LDCSQVQFKPLFLQHWLVLILEKLLNKNS
jgi:hypothetical protein